MLGLGAVPAIVLGLGMLRMPQSPRWLVMAGEDYEASAVLERIRSGDPDTIEQEIVEIQEGPEGGARHLADLLKPVVKAALVVGVGLAILQQISGINTVIYYAPTIIQFTGVESTVGRDPRLGRRRRRQRRDDVVAICGCSTAPAAGRCS